MEFKRLCQSTVRCPNSLNGLAAHTGQNIDAKSDPKSLCPQLARKLQNVTIVQKGETDIISNGMPIPSELLAQQASEQVEILESSVQGGLKRVGGQGDILSGSMGVLLAWGSEWVKGTYECVHCDR